jgi:uncharacterized membrane protein SirB2
MKLPIEGMTATVVTGVVLTALFALIANIVSGGWVIDVIIILIIWIVMFLLLVKPTPPKS